MVENPPAIPTPARMGRRVMTDQLREIQRDMAFMGWKGEAARGFSHKEDVNGEVIARAHDATWIADVEEATRRVERLAIIRELERRERERSS